MFLKVQVILIVCMKTLALHSVDKDLVLRLDPNEIVDTFKTVISSRYIREMANQMANKAAIHFINKIKIKEKMKHMSPSDRSRYLLSQKRVGRLPPEEKDLRQPLGPSTPKKEDVELKDLVTDVKSTSPPPQSKFHPHRGGEKSEELPSNQEKEGFIKPEISIQPSQSESRNQESKSRNKKQNNGHDRNVLDENVAFALLKDPSPDGDDWELDSLEISEIRNEIPVVEVKKINGVYFRRLLDMLLS